MEQPTLSSAGQEAGDLSSAPATPLRLLLVEDNTTDAELVLRALAHAGYDVTSARVETAEQMRGELARAEWDVIVADYRLPNFDGMAVLRLLQSGDKAIPLIFVSGTVDNETAIEVVRAGARDYIRKDQPTRLVAAIRRELDAARVLHVQPLMATSGAQGVGRFGIAARLMAGFIVATFLFTTLGIGYAVVYRRVNEHTVTTQAEQIARYLSVSVAQVDEKSGVRNLLFDRPALLQELVEKWAQVQKRNITIVDPDRQIVANVVSKDIGTTYRHDTGNEVALTIHDGLPRTFVETSADHHAGIRQMAVPIRAGDRRIVGALLFDYTTLYQSELREFAAQMRWFLTISFVVLAVIAGVGWATSRSVTRPLHHLRAAAQRLGRQELDAPIPIDRADEFGELAAAFEQMRVNLATALHARANLERTLGESSRALRTVIDMAPVAGMVLDRNGIVQLWNLSAEQSYGWREAEVLNRPVPGIPPDKREEFDALCKRIANGEVITGHETTRMKKDGTPIDIALSLSPLRDSSGNVTGFISTAIDNTDRKRAELALREAYAGVTASMRALESRTTELRLLHEMTNLMQSAVSTDEAYDVMHRYLACLFPYGGGALYARSSAHDLLERTLAWGECAVSLPATFTSEECWALRRGQPHCVRIGHGDMVCRHAAVVDGGERVCLPLLAHGETLGILHLCRCEGDDMSLTEPALLTLAETVANSLSLSIGNLQLRERLRQQSIRDSLTGLYNRRYLDETLSREILRARRAGSHLGVIMLDIDHFKQLNDTLGHEAGDAVLSALGRFLQHHVRGDDIACRYGGEEFTLILPGASPEMVRERAEQLRVGVQSLRVRVAGSQLNTITISSGVAAMPQHGETADAVLQAADTALYRAKQAGRNRVEVAV